MNFDNLINKDTFLSCELGKVNIIGEISSDGGQAKLYKVEVNGQIFALKYFREHFNRDSFKNSIKELISMNSKMRNAYKDFFAWPLYYVEGGPTFGYLMDYIDKNSFHLFSNWLSPSDTTVINQKNLTKIAINLCDAFSELHQFQYAYKDISPNNFFFVPNSGEIIIIDNDNITKYHENALIKGTPDFQAPELLSDCKEADPDIKSDQFSLAVLLFYIFCNQHPLQGKRYQNIDVSRKNLEEVYKMIYSKENAIFIFRDVQNERKYITDDEEGESCLNNWNMLPKYIKQAFYNTFVPGIKDKAMRTSAFEWRNLLINYLGSLMECSCLNEPSIDVYRGDDEPKTQYECKLCNKFITHPLMKINYKKQKNTKVAYSISEETYMTLVLKNREPIYYGYLNKKPNMKHRALEPIFMVYVNNNRVRIDNISNFTLRYNHTDIFRNQSTGWIDANSRKTMIVTLDDVDVLGNLRKVEMIIKF